MSGPLLLGIVAVGAGWAWVFHKPCVHASNASGATDAATNPSATAVESQTVSTENAPDANGKVDAITGGSFAPVLGDIPVAGSDGGVTLPVKTPLESSTLVIDTSKSTGGADPSTSKVWMNDGKDIQDSPPAPLPGDAQSEIMRVMYGDSGAEGLTDKQIADGFAKSSIWANEVF